MNEPNTLEGIAIIGLVGRFPGANTLEAFWNNLRNGVESISFFTEEELLASGIAATVVKQSNYIKAKGVLDGIEYFDAEFFGYTPKEAEFMDPQHRLFLETAWHALEHAGYDSERYKGWIGIFGGAGDQNYLHYILSQSHDPSHAAKETHTFFGNYRDFMISRVAYQLNLKGPGITVQTACSTSLVAINLACRSLLNYECDMALAGGCSISVPAKVGYFYEDGGIPSPDGHCRAFDEQAQGTLRGDGVGVVVLKRLDEAVRDNDFIYAVIKGFATNNDGSNKIGYTAPSVDGQAEVIALAQDMAGGEVEAISYVEAHGTGTPLGDPIEIAALTKAFRQKTQKKGFCRIGSLKTNVGHLDAAAGVASVIKTVLALQHEEIPPSLHFRKPNPKIALAQSPFYVNAQLSSWPRGTSPRRAGVSSFGIGGTNAHIILEEPPQITTTVESRPYQLLVLSAKTATALEAMTDNLISYFRTYPQTQLIDAAYTLQVGRGLFAYRRFILSSDNAAVVTTNAERMFTQKCSQSAPAIIFMFAGQGSQYVHMGKALYVGEAIFRQEIDRCAEYLLPYLQTDIRTILYPTTEAELVNAKTQINQTAWSQPILFVFEYAIAKLLMSWGITPKAMIGHSIGEYVAACLAGVFSLEQALQIVTSRGQLMQNLPSGAMLSIPLAWSAVAELLRTTSYGKLLSLAAENAPAAIVISGPTAAISQLEMELTQKGIISRRLHTSHAFHSAMMELALNPFANALKNITLQPPQLPFISNLTGTWITAAEACNPNYWVNHLRQTVQFAKGIATLASEAKQIFLEIGAGMTLTTLVRKQLEQTEDTLVLNTIPHAKASESDYAVLLLALGKLWLTGTEVDWESFYGAPKPRRIPLPLYPFKKQKHWVKAKIPSKTEAVKISAGVAQASILEPAFTPPKKVGNMADWFYLPRWQKTLPLLIPAVPQIGSPWLFLLDDGGVGQKLVDHCLSQNLSVLKVVKGDGFRVLANQEYAINPLQSGDYEKLFATLTALPKHIVYLWGTEQKTSSPYEYYNELLFLSQTLGKYTDVQLVITVITAQMQQVTGNDSTIPAKSTLLGPCKVIPLEYPNLRCRSIDFTWSALATDTTIEQLFTELVTVPTEPVIAYREGARFIQKFEPQPMTIASDTRKRLKPQGVYLITGGLGGVGLAIAEYLAKNFQAKLALVGRSKFPAKSAWNEWMLTGIAANLEEWRDRIQQQECHLHQQLAIKGIQDYLGLENLLVDLCCAHSYQYLTHGLDTTVTYPITTIKAKHKVQANLEKFFDFMCRLLSANNYALIEGEHITFSKTMPTPEKLSGQIRAEFPGFAGLIRLLNHCAHYYSQVLAGELPGVNVLYPDGQYDFLAECKQQTVEHSYEPVYRQLLGYLLTNIINTTHRPTRILEVGAGNGLLSWELIAALADRNIEYYFTDLGSAFVLRAQKRADSEGIAFLKCSVLDIAKNPLAQGFNRESFDIIIGMNVVHATPHIEETLFNLDLLLAPHGVLGLIETVHASPWVDMAWGLTDGWWYFADYPLRTQSPLLSLDQWERILQDMNYSSVNSFPPTPTARNHTDIGLILAQKPATHPKRQPKWLAEMNKRNRIQYQLTRIREMEAFGAEVEIFTADVSDSEQMASVWAKVTQQFGTINGIIHSALILQDGMMQLKSPAVAREVMLPKITGTDILYDLAKKQGLDFMAICSSLASSMGLYAQSDYCSACAYQDAFAQHHNYLHKELPVVSINWGLWQDTGAAMRTLMEKVVAANHPNWVNHPLYDYCVVTEAKIIYYGRLGLAQHWVVKEHRLANQAVVPGTAYLELISAAFQHHTKQKTFAIQQVYFLEPMVVPENREIEFHTVLEPSQDGFNFTIKSSDSKEHAKGLIVNLKAQIAPQHSLAALERLCPTVQTIIPISTTEELIAIGPVLVGPRWYSLLQEVRTGVNQAMALLNLPEKYKDDLWHYRLHPAMVDIATSFALGEGSFYLPFAYQQLRVYAPLPQKFYAHARYLEDSTSEKETLSYQLLFLDTAGNVCVAIDDYTLRKVEPTAIHLTDITSASELQVEELASPTYHPELKEGMTSEEGAYAFEVAINQSLPQVMISTQNLAEVFERNQTAHIVASKKATLQEFQALEQRIKESKLENTTAPLGEEAQLLAIWQEVLGIENIGLNDNFFELNGDSILAIMVSTRIRSTLKAEVTPDLLFKAPTIQLLANAVRDKVNVKVKVSQDDIPPSTATAEEPNYSVLPLTFSQQRMWHLNQHLPIDDIYIIPSIYKISGSLDRNALRKSLEALIERHDALRTNFVVESEYPVQVIHSTRALDLREENLLSLPVNEREPQALKLVEAELKRPFKLLVDHPCRFLLVNYAQDNYYLVINLHNIIADGWSMGILNRELGMLYEAFSQNRPSPLQALSTSYLKFTQWQVEHFKGARLEAEVSYWLDKFTKLPITQLPYDTPPSATDTRRGKSILIDIPPPVLEKVNAFNKQHGSTRFRTLGTVYGLLIYLHSRQELIYLSSPHANRDQENIEGVVGQFVNALPIAIDFSENPTFNQLVQRFTASSMELMAHTYIPFALIMKKHNLINYHLMGAEFIYHNYSLALAKLGNTDMTIVNTEVDSTAYDLEMHLWEASKVNISSTTLEGIQGELFYNCNCFKTETANRFITDFYALLERVVTQPNELISNISL